MEPFNTPLKIREISLPHRAVFGPMAGFTDAPARRLMAQHGAGFTVSEMVSSRALVYGDHKTVSLLKAEPNGAPYGVQIFGEVPEIMGQAAAAVEQYAFTISPLPLVLKLCSIFRFVIRSVHIVRLGCKAGIHNGQILVGKCHVDHNIRLFLFDQSNQLDRKSVV